jgi:hypothetical protein
MNYYFNTDYTLWHDEKRTYIIQRYESNLLYDFFMLG